MATALEQLLLASQQDTRSELQKIAERMLTAEARIRGEENFRGDIYPDTKGNPTVGFGFNLNEPSVKRHIPKDVLSKKRELTWEEGVDINKKLTNQAFDEAKRFVGDEAFSNLSRNQRDVLVDMAYNIGETSLSEFDNLRAAIQSKNYEQAAIEILDSNYAKDVPNRAMRNARIMYGEY